MVDPVDYGSTLLDCVIICQVILHTGNRRAPAWPPAVNSDGSSNGPPPCFRQKNRLA